MELFLSRQNFQIAPVLDTCGWRCRLQRYLIENWDAVERGCVWKEAPQDGGKNDW